MATANGIVFLIYCFLEFHLAIYWIKTFRIYKLFQPSTFKCCTLPFSTWNRCILLCIPLMAGLDNLRYFFGSILSKKQCISQSFQNLLHAVSFMHLVCLSYFIGSCAFFAITPKISKSTEQHQVMTNTDDNMEERIKSQTNTVESYKVRIFWILSWILTAIFFIIGLYVFFVSRDRILFDTTYGIHHWHSDHEWLSNANILIQIGFQIPIVVSMVTLIMNIIIWYKYKYWIPFVITLLSIAFMGGFASSWYDGFFFMGNLFEYTLFVQYYLIDRFLFYEKKQDMEQEDIQMIQTKISVDV